MSESAETGFTLDDSDEPKRGAVGRERPDQREETSPDELIIAIPVDDAYFHIANLQCLVEHARTRDLRDGVAARQLDFFDCSGRRLVPRLGEEYLAVGFQRSADRQEKAVLRRLGTVLDRMDRELKLHPEQGPDGLVSKVARPRGSLREWASHYARELDLCSAERRYGWFHNLMHACGL